MTGRGRRVPSRGGTQIVCGWPGKPHHGGQLLIWAAKHLTGATEGIYLKGRTDDARRWHGVRGADDFMYPADYSAKVDPGFGDTYQSLSEPYSLPSEPGPPSARHTSTGNMGFNVPVEPRIPVPA
jgi:hypothetical protein